MKTSNNGKAPPTLWCVEHVPKLKPLDAADQAEAIRMAKGMPSDPIQALFWMATLLEGMVDHRDRHFARVRQRLVVFKDRKQALLQAKKDSNEFWSAHVRPVRIM